MSTPDGSPVAMAVDPSTAVTVATTTTRRVPPPCWNDEETAALVNAYKDKWFALRRGNLRAADWDDVAAAVSSLHTLGGPAKSAIQCRHKIEKLRKRYRGEKQRSLNRPGKFSSSWDLFPILDAMEFAPVTPTAVEPYDPDLDNDDESNGLDGFRVRSKRSGKFDSPRDGFGVRSRSKSQMKMYGGFDLDHDSGGGFGLKRRYNGNPKVSGDFDADSDDEIVLVPKATRLKGSHGKPSSGEFGGGFPLKSFGDRSFASHGFKAKNFSKPEANFSPEMDYDDEFDEGFNPRIQHSRSSSRANGYGNNGEKLGYDTEAFAIYDVMGYVKPPIFTLCVGNAWGEAALLLTAGAKGNRSALPSSTIMIKQPIARFQGQATDVEIARKEIRHIKTEMVKLYSKHIGKSPEQIEADMKRPKYFSPSEAVEYGIIDKVVYNERSSQDRGVVSDLKKAQLI
ncbi:hypothetical protein F2Q70_00035314 [Brassica cretica]|uniref:ATP-dependent Clp protease proteolytic subunit n=1 Tax=Brassica cretica TaxID=69181 RepID=A0A8S9JVS6_BRACR|nr:hypothetical protein F2Q70_00035314 [Brassica cretica]